MNILNWDMKIEKVDESMKDYYTADKIYEVRSGKIVIDREYEKQDKFFTLDEFLKTWSGDWIITRVKVNGNWYVLEQK